MVQMVRVNGRECVLTQVLYDPDLKATYFWVMGEVDPYCDLNDEIEILDVRRY